MTNLRLELLLDMLDRENPALEKVFSASTPEQMQAELLAVFKKRLPKRESFPLSPVTEKMRKMADDTVNHFFTGQSAYPPQFRGKDVIDWDSNPFPDREWLWQFHRFDWLHALSAVYRQSRDEKYAEEWAYTIRSWISCMHEGERLLTHAGWRALDVARRIFNWTKSFDHFVTSPACDEEILVSFLWSLHTQAERMAALFPEGALPEQVNNWQVFEPESLILAGVLFPEFKKSREWITLSISCISRLQSRVLLHDGVISEYIPSYHSAYPAQFMSFWRIAKDNGIADQLPDSYHELLERSISAVMLWSLPDGTSPIFGDSWLTPEDTCRELVKEFLDDFPERKDWRWFVTGGKEGTLPEKNNYSLPDAGYHVIRSGWGRNDLFAVFKNSWPWHPALWHNHDDNMSFEFCAYGTRLMSDSGCYIYFGDDEARAWFRAPGAHQLISIDDLPIAGNGARLSARASSPLAEVIVLENYPYPRTLHRRTAILLEGKYLLLFDSVSGEGHGLCRQHFQFDPGKWKMDPSSLSAKTLFPGKANLLLMAAPQGKRVSMEEEEGWISFFYAKKERRAAFAFLQKKKRDENIFYLTALIPVPDGEAFPEAVLENRGENEFVFKVGNLEYEFAMDPVKGLPVIRKENR